MLRKTLCKVFGHRLHRYCFCVRCGDSLHPTAEGRRHLVEMNGSAFHALKPLEAGDQECVCEVCGETWCTPAADGQCVRCGEGGEDRRELASSPPRA